METVFSRMFGYETELTDSKRCLPSHMKPKQKLKKHFKEMTSKRIREML